MQSWGTSTSAMDYSRAANPGLTSWGILSRHYGTAPSLLLKPRTSVLGYFQPSLRDWSRYGSGAYRGHEFFRSLFIKNNQAQKPLTFEAAYREFILSRNSALLRVLPRR